jgi:hypothetical protein
MSDFTSLESAIQRSMMLSGGACLALFAVTVTSLSFAWVTARHARNIGERMPVLVVPGAIGGTYTPGLTEENVRSVARYLTNLATNFGSARSFQEHFDELEAFSSISFLPKLHHARAALQHEVETQSQSRAFFGSPATETLRQGEPGHFQYAIQGERVVYASGLPMDSRQSQILLELEWGTPSARNRSGVQLDGIDVADRAAADHRTEPHAEK